MLRKEGETADLGGRGGGGVGEITLGAHPHELPLVAHVVPDGRALAAHRKHGLVDGVLVRPHADVQVLVVEGEELQLDVAEEHTGVVPRVLDLPVVVQKRRPVLGRLQLVRVRNLQLWVERHHRPPALGVQSAVEVARRRLLALLLLGLRLHADEGDVGPPREDLEVAVERELGRVDIAQAVDLVSHLTCSHGNAG